MPMMDEILENVMIGKITRNFLKAPHQLNKVHEADAEIVELGQNADRYLAITMDALIEEVQKGLYGDPYLIGWMLSTVNFSDLAAVGAEPLGLLIAITYPQGADEEFIGRMAKGISDSCQKANSFVLGGDTSQGKEWYLCGCAIGTIPKSTVITRVGAKPEDKLYVTFPVGLGNVFAFSRLAQTKGLPEIDYKPDARLKEGMIIRRFASSCMDTSDGVMHTLDTLMRLSQCQFILHDDWRYILHPLALKFTEVLKIPPWLVLAGIHGEFELCFTISPQKEQAFLEAAKEISWAPVLLGEIAPGTGVSIKAKGSLTPVDTTRIRNLSEMAGTDPSAYISKLLEIGKGVEK